jgi:hypothetical protein
LDFLSMNGNKLNKYFRCILIFPFLLFITPAVSNQPAMVKTEGSLMNPEGISVYLENGTVIRGSEAVLFLVTNNYLEYDAQGSLRTTPKYKTWKESPATAGNFRLSGGIDKKYRENVESKVKNSGGILNLSDYSVSFEFVPDPSNPGSGRLTMSPATITHTWEFAYRADPTTGIRLVDSEKAICVLKEGSFKVLTPNDPIRMVGAWGGILNCNLERKRNNQLTSSENVDVRMQIHYDKEDRAWKVELIGLRDGLWRLQ